MSRGGGERAILAANAAFYRAFGARDAVAMDGLWARNAPVACIHPGWHALTGREQVMESWRAILGNPEQPDLRCLRATVHQVDAFAFVTCYEHIAQQLLVATNVFVLEDGEWRMVHHQSGPSAPPPDADAQSGSDTVH